MSWFSSLRSYSPLRRRSLKVEQSEGDWQQVYRLVDARSEGRCEFTDHTLMRARCPKRATDHHHCVKPRRMNQDVVKIVHLCRAHHERCDWPFARGRLVVSPLGDGRFIFSLLTEKPR